MSAGIPEKSFNRLRLLHRSNVRTTNEDRRISLTQYGLLELAVVMNIEQIPCTKSKYHAFVVLLKLVIELGGNKRRKLALRKRLVFIESLAVRWLATRIRVKTKATQET